MSLIAKIPDILKEAREEYENCSPGVFNASYQYGDSDERQGKSHLCGSAVFHQNQI